VVVAAKLLVVAEETGREERLRDDRFAGVDLLVDALPSIA
jgi:hypothetical protein